MFILNRNNDTVYEWALSTAWDITTIGSTPTSNFSVNGVVDSPNSFDFNNDGTKVYIVGDSLASVRVGLFKYCLDYIFS